MPEPPFLPAIHDAPLSVVLLVHNQAGHLETVVEGWVRVLDGLQREYEILVVDEGSGDDSVEVARALAERHGALQVLSGAEMSGVGRALQAAIDQARHPLLFYTRCDPRYRPEDLVRFLDKRNPPGKEWEINQVHIMSGYRAGRAVPWPLRFLGLCLRWLRWLILSDFPPPLPGWLGWKGHLGRLLVRIVFGLRSQDVACPYRLMRRDIFWRIPLQSRGPFVHVEILVKANFLGLLLGEEVPLDIPAEPWSQQRGGRFRDVRRDCWRVMQDPDFGPVFRPSPPTAGAIRGGIGEFLPIALAVEKSLLARPTTHPRPSLV
jgi:glycosyltransferase involved in cell wall biosynthesis